MRAKEKHTLQRRSLSTEAFLVLEISKGLEESSSSGSPELLLPDSTSLRLPYGEPLNRLMIAKQKSVAGEMAPSKLFGERVAVRNSPENHSFSNLRRKVKKKKKERKHSFETVNELETCETLERVYGDSTRTKFCLKRFVYPFFYRSLSFFFFFSWPILPSSSIYGIKKKIESIIKYFS